MRACDQCTIFSTGGKFCPDYGLLLELHALTPVACSYVLLSVLLWELDAGKGSSQTLGCGPQKLLWGWVRMPFAVGGDSVGGA